MPFGTVTYLRWDGTLIWTGSSTDTLTASGDTSCNGSYYSATGPSGGTTTTDDSYNDDNEQFENFSGAEPTSSDSDTFSDSETITSYGPGGSSTYSPFPNPYLGSFTDGTTGFGNHLYGNVSYAPLGNSGVGGVSAGGLASPGMPTMGAGAPSAGAGLLGTQAAWLTEALTGTPGIPSADATFGGPSVGAPATAEATLELPLGGSPSAAYAPPSGTCEGSGGVVMPGLPAPGGNLPAAGTGLWGGQTSWLTMAGEMSVGGFLPGVPWSATTHGQTPLASFVPDQGLCDVQQDAAAQASGGASFSGLGGSNATFDATGQITGVTDSLGGTTTAGYDAAGRLTSVTDPPTASNKTGNTTAWTYNNQNRVTSQTTAQGTSYFAYASPSCGNLTQYTDADGRVTTYQYDSQNRVTQETWYPNASALAAHSPEEIINYTYDSDGDITAESDFNCAQSQTVSADYYAYNDSDQLTAVVETEAGGPAVQLAYTYNDAGECSGVTASIGGNVDSSGDYSGGTLDYQNAYAYDTSGDLTQIVQSSQTGGDAVAQKEIDLTYNAAGQFQSIDRYENGQFVAETDYTYNSAGQLTSLVHQQGSTVLASYSYTYGSGTGSSLAAAVQPVTPTVWTPSGATLPFNDPSQIDLSSLDQAPSPASLLASVTSVDGTTSYSYDAQDELTSASYTGGQPSESYAWDANGNPSGSNYVIGPDNEILSDGTYNYTYDADGNMVTRTQISSASSSDYETTYTWDNRNRLVAVTNQDNSGTITQTVSYQYDVENRWVGETITSYSGGVATSVHTTDFAYDGTQIVLQFDATSTPGTPVTLTANNLSHRYVAGPAVDQVLADDQATNPQTPGNVVWTLTDNEGTIRDLAVYNAQTGTTAVVNHRTYDPFGKLLSQTNPATGTAAAVDCLFGYTGCATDANTDIEFHEHREKIGGNTDWLSQDPINFTSGVTNLNDYCGNDPINATDPSGEGSWTRKTHRFFGNYNGTPNAQTIANSSRLSTWKYWFVLLQGDASESGGHAWVAVIDSTTKTVSAVGYYPKTPVSMSSPTAGAEFSDDSGREYTVAIAFPITLAQYTNAKTFLSALVTTPPTAPTGNWVTYDLQTQNCADWAEAVAAVVLGEAWSRFDDPGAPKQYAGPAASGSGFSRPAYDKSAHGFMKTPVSMLKALRHFQARYQGPSGVGPQVFDNDYPP